MRLVALEEERARVPKEFVVASDGGQAVAARDAERAQRRESAAAAAVVETGQEAMAGATVETGGGEGEASPWPDEAAEASFLSDARERGEVVVAKKAEEVAEETTAKPLPALDSLVERIPAEVRDVLEDLFRAKFVSVKRVPKKALKA